MTAQGLTELLLWDSTLKVTESSSLVYGDRPAPAPSASSATTMRNEFVFTGSLDP